MAREAPYPYRPALSVAALQSAAFLGWGASLFYLSVWYEDRGLTEAQIGLAAGLGLLVRGTLNPLMGAIADTLGSVRRVLVIAAVGAMIGFGLHLPSTPAVVIIIITAVSTGLYSALLPLADVTTMRASRRFGFAYGPIRSLGSAVFIFANIAAGYLISSYGADVVIYWMMAASALTGLVALQSPGRVRPLPGDPRHGFRQGFKDLWRADFGIAIFAASAIQGAHAFYYYFAALYLKGLGYDGLTVGIVLSTAVVAEIILLWAFGAKLEKRRTGTLFAIGGLSSLIRWGIMACEPGLGVILLSQCLHAGTFAVTHLALIMFVARRIPERSQGLAQSSGSAITGGLAAAAIAALSGVLYGACGAGGFWAMAGFGAVGLLAGLWLLRLQPVGGVPPYEPRALP